jgi:hypothetical protein
MQRSVPVVVMTNICNVGGIGLSKQPTTVVIKTNELSFALLRLARFDNSNIGCFFQVDLFVGVDLVKRFVDILAI